MSFGPDSRGALVALKRFGLGPKPGDLFAAAADPRGFILVETQQAGVALLEKPQLAKSSAALQALFADQQNKRSERERTLAQGMASAAQAGLTGSVMAAAPQPMPVTAAIGPDGKPKPQDPTIEQRLFRAEAMARYEKQVAASAGFVERLIAFWSNHFAVSAAKDQFVRVAAGPYEREAIRPYVLGKFADMLKAVESHPSMLFYLDNQRSSGPNSAAGRFAGKGLNENLAREILELHTLGAEGGYRQDAVTALARILTDWSIAQAESEVGTPGAFLFKSNWHEPGAQILLGETYAQTGVRQGEAALAAIARHPSTATHIATKLVRHFIADDPPPGMIAKLAKAFRDTDGDLHAVTVALAGDDEAWRLPMTKIRTPNEFLIAAMRATGSLPAEPGPILNMSNALGMPLWQPAGPNGFADTQAAWATPESMKLRLDVAAQLAQRAKDVENPLSVLDSIAGPEASTETRGAVSRAESRQQALAIIFMSPEFQRR